MITDAENQRFALADSMARTAEMLVSLSRGDPWTLRDGAIVETATGRHLTWPEVGAALADAFDAFDGKAPPTDAERESSEAMLEALIRACL